MPLEISKRCNSAFSLASSSPAGAWAAAGATVGTASGKATFTAFSFLDLLRVFGGLATGVSGADSDGIDSLVTSEFGVAGAITQTYENENPRNSFSVAVSCDLLYFLSNWH